MGQDQLRKALEELRANGPYLMLEAADIVGAEDFLEILCRRLLENPSKQTLQAMLAAYDDVAKYQDNLAECIKEFAMLDPKEREERLRRAWGEK